MRSASYLLFATSIVACHAIPSPVPVTAEPLTLRLDGVGCSGSNVLVLDVSLSGPAWIAVVVPAAGRLVRILPEKGPTQARGAGRHELGVVLDARNRTFINPRGACLAACPSAVALRTGARRCYSGEPYLVALPATLSSRDLDAQLSALSAPADADSVSAVLAHGLGALAIASYPGPT